MLLHVALLVKKLIHILLFFCVFILTGVCTAGASVSHHHHEVTSDSPFQGKSATSSVHCLLKKHFHAGQVCPHIKNKNGDRQVRLAADCGGGPNGSVPPIPNPNKSHFLFSAVAPLPAIMSAENIFVSSEIFLQLFPESIDDPPRS